MEGGNNRIARKKALTMPEILQMYIKEMKISSSLNTQRVFKAWDAVSGAEKYTSRRFYRDGRLFITLSSSVVRNQLSFQKEVLLEKMNDALAADELFTQDDPKVSFVREIVLK